MVKLHFTVLFYGEIYGVRWNALVEFMAAVNFTSLVLAAIQMVVMV